ncbi:DUF1385 domain-containing protein [Patescibacteria group bacterium]|nr:DUF1385 domain-containing protein [Patescibacteria group bacterium]
MIRDKRERKVRSKHYRKGKIILLGIQVGIIIIIGGSLLDLAIIRIISGLWFLTFLTLTAFVFLLFSNWLIYSLLAPMPYIGRSFKEWHATEHKLIYLLENGERLTLENLRAAPSRNRRCASRNMWLKEPSDDKLEEAFRVGREYLNLFT